MKKFALCLLALCAALVPVGGLAVPGWAKTYTISSVEDIKKAESPFEEYGNYYAIMSTSDCDVLNITGDITELDKGLSINKSTSGAQTLIINGNGKKLSLQNGSSSVIYIIAGNITINDLTITGGRATYKNDAEKGNGGGILAGGYSLTAINCNFKDNTATGDGGGIYASDCDLTVENCRFWGDTDDTSNTANSGGGIYFQKGQGDHSLTVKNCTFTGNSAINGGGVYVSNSGTQPATLTNCTFYNNGKKNNINAEKGGGLCVGAGSVTVNYCTFVNNTATTGAEICADNGATPTVTNSLIWNKEAQTPIATNSTAITLDHCAVREGVINNENIKDTDTPSCVILKDWTPGEPSTGTRDDVTHSVYRIEDYEALKDLKGKGKTVPGITDDQLRDNIRKDPPDIGAMAYTDHVHNFTYSADGATITATCTSTTGTCDLTDNKVTLTIKAPTNLTYDGKAKAATLEGADAFNKATGQTVSENNIIYSSGKAPVDAGTYTAWVTVSNYTATVSYTITGQPTPTPTPTPTETVATPTFSPVGGTYTEARSVTITCGTKDAAIYYTTDGSKPTAKSTPYTRAITVSKTTTINAIAVKSGMENSAVAMAIYTINSGSTDPTYDITPPQAKNLVYTGEAQALVTPGKVSNSSLKMQYSLSASGPFSVEIPMGKDSKEYIVHWRVVDSAGNVVKSGSVKSTIDPPKTEITGVKLNITTDTSTITLKPGHTATLKFTATATVTYKDGSTKTEPAKIYLWWMYDNLDWPEWLSITERGDGKATVTASPTEGVGGGTRTVHIAAKTQSACYNSHYDWTRCEFSINVDVPETFKPGTLTFDKAHVEMTAAPGDTVEESVNVDFKLRGSGGTIKDDTEGEYAIKCQKIDGPDWVTASVAGQKVTFRATAPKTGATSSTSIFNVYVQDKDGKQYLKTSYRVVANVAKLKSYQITVAPAEITCLDTNLNEVAMDLNPYVRLEKLYDNGTRKPVDDFGLEFTPPEKDGTTPNWLDFRENGWVRIDPRFPKEVGEYFYTYKVTATTPDGQTKTGTGALTVNIISEGAPEITNETLKDAEAYAAYSEQLYATGTGITWEVEGKLPTGMSLNKETGKISGTPKIEPKNFTFTVKATNSAGSVKREFTIKVVDQKIKVGDQKVPWKTSYTTSVKKTSSSSKGTWKVKFNVKNGTNVKYEDASDRGILDKNHLKEVVVTKGGKPGDGLIQYTLYWPYDKTTKQGAAYTYNFKVQASNTTGKSTLKKSYIVDEDGNVGKPDDTASVTVASGPAVVLTDEDDGETFEPYKDGQAQDSLGSGVIYLADGGADVEVDANGNPTGNIWYTVVIDGYTEEGNYEFASLDDLKSAQYIPLEKITHLEFRRGATLPKGEKLTPDDLKELTHLEGLTINNCDFTELDLNGMTGLTDLSLYGCGKLTSLNVKGCSSLAGLTAYDCTALEKLNVEGCKELEDVSVTDAPIGKELDLSNRAKLTYINVSGCRLLLTLNVTGCPELTDLNASYSAVSKLDLSACKNLKSLSLAETNCLSELKLPENAEIEDLDIASIGIGTLNLSGRDFTALDFSGCSGLSELNLKDCAALEKLNLTGCENLSKLNLEGCTALKELIANGCKSLTDLTLDSGKLRTLELDDTDSLKTLNCAKNALGHLDLDGGWHSFELANGVDCSPQFIGASVIEAAAMDTTVDLHDYAGGGVYRVSNVKGYTADGAEIAADYDNKTGIATFASAPAEISYVYNTHLPGVKMEVTVSSSNDPVDRPDSPTSNRGGGGCDSGLGVLALSAVGLLSVKRRK